MMNFILNDGGISRCFSHIDRKDEKTKKHRLPGRKHDPYFKKSACNYLPYAWMLGKFDDVSPCEDIW